MFGWICYSFAAPRIFFRSLLLNKRQPMILPEL
jgi:hypothetical protein